MQHLKYRKVSYVLPETPGMSGKIAFEFLSKIVMSSDSLRFSFRGQGENNESFDKLLTMNNEAIIIINNTNEKTIVIKNIIINENLLEILCSLGKYPNFLEVSKINENLLNSSPEFYWSIGYCDEIFTFDYLDGEFDCSKLDLIEKEFENKGIRYERKKMK